MNEIVNPRCGRCGKMRLGDGPCSYCKSTHLISEEAYFKRLDEGWKPFKKANDRRS